MRIPTLLKLAGTLLLAAALPALAADEKAAMTLSAPHALPGEIAALVKLDAGQKIEVDKSLRWQVNGKEFYYLPVSYKKNQGCRFVFVDGIQKKIISDGDLNFEKCSFTKAPVMLDINRDGYMDFKVWLRLPHHPGSGAMVNHDLDFIYDPQKSLFCESNIGIPCTSPEAGTAAPN